MAEAVSHEAVRRDIETLRDWIDGCPAGGMVFFGGAGVPTESGIPDFRSADGLYARPNRAHEKLAELEARGICSAVITQNIDGLHQAAGSKNVLELHGSAHRDTCIGCGRRFDLAEVTALHEAAPGGVPRCRDCGAIVKPDVVLYEEPLDEAVLEASVNAIARASLLVVAGTSLVVYPAAGLLRYFQGSHLAIVNLSPTAADQNADFCIPAKVGEVFDW